MRAEDFEYKLPPELIAQAPAPERDWSRLLVLRRTDGQIAHRAFRDIVEYLRPGDVLVLNNTKVIPARLRAAKAGTGGHLEVLLTEQVQRNDWKAMLRPAKRARPGARLQFIDRTGRLSAVEAVVIEKGFGGHCRLQFSGADDVAGQLAALGQAPLPPYINRQPNNGIVDDTDRYQTVYAQCPGSVAAPTAGLHFTQAMLEQIRQAQIKVCCLTLHIGPGTFVPVKAETVAEHKMHQEHYELSAETALTINQAKQTRHNVVAVGTTAVRVLETVAAQNQGKLSASTGRTGLFVYPPFRFNIVDVLLTNFHLPRSTLLMLVCAFAAPESTGGIQPVLKSYAEAIRLKYRFYSYGDAMLVV